LVDIGQRSNERRRRRFHTSALLALLVCIVLVLPGSVVAQFGETAEVERLIPATNSLDATAAGTEILIRDRVVAQTTEQLLLEAAGTRVVSTGAPGSFFCLRLRGVACDQSTTYRSAIPIPDRST
jgi:hypothetical protein